MTLLALRQELARVVDGDDAAAAGRASRPALSTGVVALDRVLADGGLPRGRLTEIVGAMGSGRTTLLRRMVETAAEHGGWVAYVDATRTLAPREWAHLGARPGVWIVRPRDPGRGAWCADVLLRSGAFGLVVLDGAPTLPRAVAGRRGRLARASDSAFVVAGEGGARPATLLGGSLRLRLECAADGDAPPPAKNDDEQRPHRRGQRMLRVCIEKGGTTHQPVEVSCAIGVARRLCAHPEVPDRRGVGGASPASSGSRRRNRGRSARGRTGGGGAEAAGARVRGHA
jgi:hypothetical protein